MSPGVPAEVGTGIEYQMLMAVQRWYRPAPEAQPLFRIDPTKGPGSQWQPSPIVDNRGHCFVRNFAEMELIPLGSSLRTVLRSCKLQGFCRAQLLSCSSPAKAPIAACVVEVILITPTLWPG
eukprot:scaffold127680_cov20-Tisochrysis_lutea.AAC.1